MDRARDRVPPGTQNCQIRLCVQSARELLFEVGIYGAEPERSFCQSNRLGNFCFITKGFESFFKATQRWMPHPRKAGLQLVINDCLPQDIPTLIIQDPIDQF